MSPWIFFFNLTFTDVTVAVYKSARLFSIICLNSTVSTGLSVYSDNNALSHFAVAGGEFPPPLYYVLFILHSCLALDA